MNTQSPRDPFMEFQSRLIAGVAIAIVPSALASVGGVFLNGGHALTGVAALVADFVLGLSLVTGIGVVLIGFRRFLAAQAEARRRSKEKHPGSK